MNATVPLFTFLIANIFLIDERLKPQKILSLLIGFGGVIILLIKDFHPGSNNSLLGQAAVILAAIFYAGSMVYARIKTHRVPGLVRGIMPFISATAIMGTGSLILESPLQLPVLPISWLAVIWLGVLGSGLAFILWYYLLQEELLNPCSFGDLCNAFGWCFIGCDLLEGTSDMESGVWRLDDHYQRDPS